MIEHEQPRFEGRSGRGYITEVGGVHMQEPIPVLIENGKIVGITVVVTLNEMERPLLLTFEEV